MPTLNYYKYETGTQYGVIQTGMTYMTLPMTESNSFKILMSIFLIHFTLILYINKCSFHVLYLSIKLKLNHFSSHYAFALFASLAASINLLGIKCSLKEINAAHTILLDYSLTMLNK